MAIYSIVALGLGLLVGPRRHGVAGPGRGAGTGRAGSPRGCCSPPALPFPLVLLGAGLITMVLGTLVGLPALRMSGLYLALITLMLAGAITVALATINFPNGGHGFTGYDGGSVHIPAIRRPASPPPIRRSSATRWSWDPDVPVGPRPTSVGGPGGRGRRSARASRPRSPPASTPRSTSSGRSRWPRSSPASPEAWWPAVSGT